MNFYPNGGGAGRLHAEVGQPGLMVLTDERFDGTHLSGVVHAGAQTSFQLKFKRAQNEINVAVASGRITIRSKSTEGEWSMEDAPVTCK